MRINEIFLSLQGEVNSIGGQGTLAIFIRFQGCSLKCWGGQCDTRYSQAFNGGKRMTPTEILNECEKYSPCKTITWTGGEVLEQRRDCKKLALLLRAAGYCTSLETNGANKLKGIKNYFDSIVMDCKCPSTGVSDRMLFENWKLLENTDWIKFVVADRRDYDWMKKKIKEYKTRARIAVSPKWGEIEPKKIVEWMKEDGLVNVTLNIQLHKVIYGATKRGV